MFSEVSITFHGDKWVSAGVLNTQKGIVGAPSSVIDIHGKQVWGEERREKRGERREEENRGRFYKWI